MERNYNLFIDGTKYNVHHVFSPIEGFDDEAEGHVRHFRNMLLSGRITKDMRAAYIKALEDFPTYKETTDREGTVREKADRFMELIISPEVGNLCRAIEKGTKSKELGFYTVAFFETILRDIELVKGGRKHYMGHFNYDLDCACASILRNSHPSDFALGDYFARYIIADDASPFKVFTQ